MKKHIITGLLLLLPTISMGCQVVLINNGPYDSVSIKDLRAPKKSFRVVKKGEKVNANFDPDAHAQLLVSMGNTFYKIQQHACSKSHIIPITTQHIEQEEGGKFLKIIKGKSLLDTAIKGKK